MRRPYCSAIKNKNINIASAASGCETCLSPIYYSVPKNRDVLADALSKKKISLPLFIIRFLCTSRKVFLKLYNVSVKLPMSENCAREVLSLAGCFRN